jgi:hypothetical protein
MNQRRESGDFFAQLTMPIPFPVENFLSNNDKVSGYITSSKIGQS